MAASTTAEREELSRLRRENRKLKKEREILSNVWSARLIDNLAAWILRHLYRVANGLMAPESRKDN